MFLHLGSELFSYEFSSYLYGACANVEDSCWYYVNR